MVNKFLQTIYEKTFYIVQNILAENEVYKKKYYLYLSSKYGKLLEQFVLEESEEMVQAIVNSYVEDEIRIFGNLSRNEILSILDKDQAFEQLVFLSEVAFEQAKESIKTGTYLNNNEEYKLRLEEFVQCLDAIKPHNVEAAKEILSESILDIDFLFKKSDIMSLRLARTLEL